MDLKNINTSLKSSKEHINYYSYGWLNDNEVINPNYPVQNKIVQTTEWLELEFMFGIIVIVTLLLFFYSKPILSFIDNSRNKSKDKVFDNIQYSDRFTILELDENYKSPSSIFSWLKHRKVKQVFVFSFGLLFTIMSYKEMLGIVEQAPVVPFGCIRF